MRKFLYLLFSALCLLSLSACNSSSQSASSSERIPISKPSPSPGRSESEKDPLYQLSSPQEGDMLAVLDTDFGTITIRLFPEIAPLACENFRALSEDGSYDNMKFHRVIEGFMIQSGRFNWRGGESAYGEPFEDEPSDELWNFRGALCMAHANEPDQNESQWYIVKAAPEDMTPETLADLQSDEDAHPDAVREKYLEIGGAPWLDGDFTVFGQVIEGMDVVDRISEVKTDQNDRPEEAVFIRSIEITTYTTAD